MKLKGLLAKVHHSNQKNVQDTQSARQGHRVAAEELRERVQEQQSQTQLLQQQLRYMSFESAFQADMETAIEKASQQLTSHQQVCTMYHECLRSQVYYFPCYRSMGGTQNNDSDS